MTRLQRVKILCMRNPPNFMTRFTEAAMQRIRTMTASEAENWLRSIQAARRQHAESLTLLRSVALPADDTDDLAELRQHLNSRPPQGQPGWFAYMEEAVKIRLNQLDKESD